MPQPSVASSRRPTRRRTPRRRSRASRPGAGARRGSSRRAASPRAGSARARRRACPSSCGGSATAARRSAARGSQRQLRPAAERALDAGRRPRAPRPTTPTCAGEPPCDAHASARWRVAEPEALEHAGAHAAERLQRLDRRAREDRQLRRRARRTAPSGCATHQATRCSDSDRPAPERDDPRQERVSRQRARLSSISCSASVALVPAVDDDLLALRLLVDREEVLDLDRAAGRAGRRARAARSSSGPSAGRRGSCRPAPCRRSCGRRRSRVTAIRQPENVGSETQTIASSGSPSSPERVGDEAVVGRVDDRREQEAVELDAAERLVPLVLVARPLRDLDEAVEGLVHARANDSERHAQGLPRLPHARQRHRPRGRRGHRRGVRRRRGGVRRPTSSAGIIGAIGGTPDFGDAGVTVNGSKIVYGSTITALINFADRRGRRSTSSSSCR